MVHDRFCLQKVHSQHNVVRRFLQLKDRGRSRLGSGEALICKGGVRLQHFEGMTHAAIKICSFLVGDIFPAVPQILRLFCALSPTGGSRSQGQFQRAEVFRELGWPGFPPSGSAPAVNLKLPKWDWGGAGG